MLEEHFERLGLEKLVKMKTSTCSGVALSHDVLLTFQVKFECSKHLTC